MLCRKCDTRDPFTIAAKLGIRVLHEPLGSIRGYYSRTHRIKFIHINQDLCINRSDSATYTDFFRHRAGDFLPPNRSTLPLKAQPVQALAEQVSIF